MTDNKDELAKLLDQLEGYMRSCSSRDIHIAQSRARAIARQILAERCGDREQHLTWQIADEAYKLILETEMGAKESLVLAATKFSKEVERVLAEKSNPSQGLNRSVIKNNDNHPVQVDMVKRKKFHRQSIKNSKNVWQMLLMLTYFKQAYTEALEIEMLRKDVEIMRGQQVLSSTEITRLQETFSINPLSTREKVQILKGEGYDQTTIAKILNVSKGTVSKSWKL